VNDFGPRFQREPTIDTAPREGGFSVLAYNVAGLPLGLSGSTPELNNALISPRLNAFDLVAVHPKTGSPAQIVLNSTAARRNAENVMRTLAEQGLPTSRVGMNSMSSATVQANEVRVYVR